MTTYTGGWNCAVCGQWIRAGSGHACSGTFGVKTSEADQLAQILMALGRIEQLCIDLKIRTAK